MINKIKLLGAGGLVLIGFIFFSHIYQPEEIFAIRQFPLFKQKAELSFCADDKGRPIIRLFTTSNCQGCVEIAEAYKDSLQPFLDQGLVNSKIWLKDKEDIPDNEMEICYQLTDGRCPSPTLILGCKYYGVVDTTIDKVQFKTTAKEIVEHILSVKPEDVIASPIPPVHLSSDINGDELTDSKDAKLVIHNLFKPKSLIKVLADINKDDKVNIIDYGWVMKNYQTEISK